MTRQTSPSQKPSSVKSLVAFGAALLACTLSQAPALADFASTAPPAVNNTSPTSTFAASAPAVTPAFQTGGESTQQQSAAAPLPLGANYHIHPGDLVAVQVYGDQSLSQNTMVLPDGTINYPLVGRVYLRGLSTEDAALAITHKLQAYVKHPYVTVSVAAAAQYTVQVLGNVKTPGKYQLRSDARVSDAIAAAGGLAPFNGNLPMARISIGTKNVEQVSLQHLFHDGDTSQNLALADGSVVYVPSPNTFDVEVVGSVDHPGNVTLNEGDRLSMAIAKAGNSSNSSADLNQVHITRINPDGKTQAMTINLYKTLINGDVRSDITMQKGDVVYVPIARGNGRPNSAGASALLFLGRLVGLPTY